MPAQPTALVEYHLDRIIVGDRCRRDLGDLAALAASISEIGLLHPVVITREACLIAGRRRMEACRLLGCSTILCCVVEDLHDALPMLQAELQENTCRKRFLPSEAAIAADQLLPALRAAARLRMHHQAEQGASVNLTEAPEAMEAVAAMVGLSRGTLEKARKVVQAAREDEEGCGDLVARMDRTGKVNGAYTELQKRQGCAPPKAAAPCHISIRIAPTGAIKITGSPDKSHLIAELKRLLHHLEHNPPP